MFESITAFLRLDGSNFAMGMDGAATRTRSFGKQMNQIGQMIRGSFAIYTVSKFVSLVGDAASRIEDIQKKTGKKLVSDEDLANAKAINREMEQFKTTLSTGVVKGLSPVFKGFQVMYATAEKLFGKISDDLYQQNLRSIINGGKDPAKAAEDLKKRQEIEAKLAGLRDKLEPPSLQEQKRRSMEKIADLEKQMADRRVATNEFAFKERQVQLLEEQVRLQGIETDIAKEKVKEEEAYEQAVAESKRMIEGIRAEEKARYEAQAEGAAAAKAEAKREVEEREGALAMAGQTAGSRQGRFTLTMPPSMDRHFGKLNQTALRQEITMKRLLQRIERGRAQAARF